MCVNQWEVFPPTLHTGFNMIYDQFICYSSLSSTFQALLHPSGKGNRKFVFVSHGLAGILLKELCLNNLIQEHLAL